MIPLVLAPVRSIQIRKDFKCISNFKKILMYLKFKKSKSPIYGGRDPSALKRMTGRTIKAGPAVKTEPASAAKDFFMIHSQCREAPPHCSNWRPAEARHSNHWAAQLGFNLVRLHHHDSPWV